MANEFKIRKGLIVTGASGGTVVDIQGSQGQLFSVTDDLSGSIFAVSDISGVPILDINSSGTSLFTGLVSGITPVDAANFVTKAYVDGSGGGTGPFLPLAGGTLTGALGIGVTPSNGYSLDITPSAGNILRSTRGSSVMGSYQSLNGPAYSGTISNDNFVLISNDIARLTLNADGTTRIHNSTSIGTTVAPTRTLDVRGTGMSIFGTGGNTELMLRGQVEGTGTVRNLGSWHISVRGDVAGNNDDLKLLRFITGTYSGWSMVVQNTTGKMAIGTNTLPSDYRLIIEDSSEDLLRLHNSTDGLDALISFTNPGGTLGRIQGIDNGGLGFDTGNNAGGINTNAMFIKNNGYVGIGTTGPTQKLNVDGNTQLGRNGNNTAGDPQKTIISGQGIEDVTTGNFYGSYGFLEFNANNNYTGSARRYAITNGLKANKFAIIRSDSNMATMQLGVAGDVPSGSVADFVIDNLGKVGIGNESPGAKLVVGANVNASATGIEVNAGAGGGNVLSNGTADNWFPYTDNNNYYSATDHIFRSEVNSDTRMTIKSSGNVLIGTTAINGAFGASNTILAVKGSSSGGEGIIQITGLGNNATDNVGVLAFHSYNEADAMCSIRSVRGNADDVGNMVFLTNNGGTESERARIDSNGVFQLTSDINGYLNANTIGMEIDINRNPETGTFEDTSLSHARIIMRGDTTANGGSNIKFVTSPTVNTVGTTKMTIAGDGNVGIGETNPGKKIDVYQSTVGIGAADFRHVNGNRILVNPSYNYYDAYNHIFRGLNGTNTHMTIDLSGNVGINTTNPGKKLEVAGSYKLGTNAYIEYGGVYPYTITTANTAGIGNLVFSAGLGSAAYESRIDLQGTNTAGVAGITLSTASTARMVVTADGDVGIGTTTPNAKLDIQGTQGQLFSVTDNLSGDIFSVADISGVPIMNINSNGTITIDGHLTSTGLNFINQSNEYNNPTPGISSFGDVTMDSTVSFFSTGVYVSGDTRGITWTGEHYILTEYIGGTAKFYDNNFELLKGPTNSTITLPLPATGGQSAWHGAAWDGRYLYCVLYGGTGAKIIGYDLDNGTTTATIVVESFMDNPGATYAIEYAEGHLYTVTDGEVSQYKLEGKTITHVQTSGNILSGIEAQAITYDGSYLWITQNGLNVYKVNLDCTLEATITTGYPPNNTGWGWNGQNINAVNYQTGEIYIVRTAAKRIDTEKLLVMGGKVGIGNTSPDKLLHVGDGLAQLGSPQGAEIEGYNDTLDLRTNEGNSIADFTAALNLFCDGVVGSSGTGTGIYFRAKTGGGGGGEYTKGRIQGAVYTSWTTNTDATRTSKLVIQTTNSGTHADRVTILGNGDFGINDTSPSNKLDVNGDIRGTQYKLRGNVSNPTSTAATIYDQSGVGLTLSAHNVELRNYNGSSMVRSVFFTHNSATFTGTCTATNFILSSDKTLKENIKDIDKKHIDVNWKNFELKSEPGIKRAGVIAQELETKHPEFVRTNEDGLKSVAYVDLLIAKIAELEARLEKAGI